MPSSPCSASTATCGAQGRLHAPLRPRGIHRRPQCPLRHACRAVRSRSALQPCCAPRSPDRDASEGDQTRDQGGAMPMQPSLDWRAFRARLVAAESSEAVQQESNAGLQQVGEVQWAHRLAAPEAGCLLMGRQPGMGIFERSVILMLEHSDKHRSIGLVLNLPAPLLVKDVAAKLSAVKGIFGQHRLYVGGPLHTNIMHMLHAHEGMRDATEVLPGVFLGGEEHLMEKMLSGDIPNPRIRFLAGIASWGAYQLSSEILEESWWVVSASNNTVQDLISAGADDRAADVVRDVLWLNLLSLAQIEPNLRFE